MGLGWVTGVSGGVRRVGGVRVIAIVGVVKILTLWLFGEVGVTGVVELIVLLKVRCCRLFEGLRFDDEYV